MPVVRSIVPGDAVPVVRSPPSSPEALRCNPSIGPGSLIGATRYLGQKVALASGPPVWPGFRSDALQDRHLFVF